MPMIDVELEALAAELGRALVGRGWMCVTAESCTGGLVAGAMTAIAGSSDWFDRGFVTYSDEAKMEALGVPSMVLAGHGAVSEATARELASGAIARSRGDIAVAVTGIAGPSGGSPAKPVGTVCFAWSVRGGETTSATRQFEGGRTAVRRASVVVALDGLIERVRGSG
jgi:nicotinamide-nucleotide amidase